MTLKDLHESWVKTGYPSRTEIRKAIEGLLAEPSNGKSAMEQMVEWLKTMVDTHDCDYYYKKGLEISLDKARSLLAAEQSQTPTEPLACLAARKGKWVQIIKQKNNWWFDVFRISGPDENELESTPDYTVGVPEYKTAESKAREFLMALPDGKEGV